MVRLSFAALALSLMLLTGCVHQRSDTARSEYQRTETTRVQEGNAEGTALGTQSQQSETIETHQKTTTTERSKE